MGNTSATKNPDQATDLPDVSIRMLKGVKYVVWWNKAKASSSIVGLAKYLALQPEQALEACLTFTANAPCVQPLWENYVKTGNQKFPGMATARVQLKKAASVESYNDDAGPGTITHTVAYATWGLSPDLKALLFPFSKGFQAVLDKATADRKKAATLKALVQPMDDLNKALIDIRIQTDALATPIKWFNDGIVTAAKEVAILQVLDALLTLCLKHPQKDPSDGDKQFAYDLQSKLQTLIQQANHYMLLDPQNSTAQNNLKMSRDAAAKLMGMIDDPTFQKNVKMAADNHDLVDGQLWTDLCQTLEDAGTTLLRSNKAEEFVEKHVNPLLATIAARPIDTSGLTTPHVPGLDTAIAGTWTAPASMSPYAIIATVEGSATQMAGNLPGPSTLAVLIVKAAAPVIARKVVLNRLSPEALQTTAKLYRFLVTDSDLTKAERATLLQAIDEGDLKKAARIPWGDKFMASEGWGAAMAIANLAVLLAVCLDPNSKPVDKIVAALNTAPGIILGVATAAKSYFTFLQEGAFRVGGPASELLGCIGGMVAIVMGVKGAMEAYEAKDGVEVGVGAATAVGGALSLAGFLVASGTACDATVFGAPVGVVLQVAGVVLMLGAVVVDIVHKYFTSDSLQLFQAYIDRFGSGNSPMQYGDYAFTKGQPNTAPLVDAYEAVKSAEHHVWKDLWKPNMDAVPRLKDLGFTKEQVQQLTGYSVDTIASKF